MKSLNTSRVAIPCHTRLAGALLVMLATLMSIVACSTEARPSGTVSPAGAPVSAKAGQASGAVVATSANGGPMGRTVTSGSAKGEPIGAPVTPAPAKAAPIVYKSRDYGVSFTYPWQYTRLSARTVNDNPELRPKSDGYGGQLTLVRVEIPRGFYPDTDFERGYFTLSLNQDLDEQQCQATLGQGKVETETIKGVEYRWVETDAGGRGSAANLRNYAAFTNGTCYELEIGVRTSNRDGMAREINPDQVLQRLQAIVRSVEIMPALQSASAKQ